jgi:hypothetical protein
MRGRDEEAGIIGVLACGIGNSKCLLAPPSNLSYVACRPRAERKSQIRWHNVMEGKAAKR